MNEAIQYLSAPAYLPSLFNMAVLLIWLVVALYFTVWLDKRRMIKGDKEPTPFQKAYNEADANYRLLYSAICFAVVYWSGAQILPV